MHPNAIVNKCVARARLQSKICNSNNNDLYREEYGTIISKINPNKNIIGFAKEGRRNLSGKNGYCYFACNPNNVFKRITRHESCSFYEILPIDYPLKFFDVDGPIPELFCEAIENMLINYYEGCVKFTPPRIILTASKGSKESYHIVYPTVVFSNMEHLRNFINSVLAPLHNKFDTAVYSSFRLLRIYLNTKFNQDRPFIHHSNTLYSPPRTLSDQEIFLLSLVSYQQYNSTLLTCNSDLALKLRSSRNFSNILKTPPTISTPSIIKKFLLNFPAASVGEAIPLVRTEPSKKLFAFPLKHFPCPYNLAHIHSRNHPYIVYSPRYRETLEYVFIGCHKESRIQRISADSLLKRMI